MVHVTHVCLACLWFRFSQRFTGGGLECTKKSTKVQFPLELDLNEYVIEELQPSTSFRLIGVIDHRGTLSTGNYSAFCWKGGR